LSSGQVERRRATQGAASGAPDIDKLRAALEQRPEQWKADLR